MKKISVSNIARKDKASLTTGFPSSESIESTNNFLGDLTQWKKIRMFGSAALSCAYISSVVMMHTLKKVFISGILQQEFL